MRATAAHSCSRVGLLVTMLGGMLCSASCFGTATSTRRYYVLHAKPALSAGSEGPIMAGLVRVRDLDADSTYDKFQIVVRTSPYELAYRESNVWAVKPNRMVSDEIAKTLHLRGIFGSVTRELGERRPDYILAGDLHAIEVYDSGDLWFAHFALSLSLSSFDSGRVLWTFGFDERKVVPTRTFSHAARALSELLSSAIDRALGTLDDSPTPAAGQPDPASNRASGRPATRAGQPATPAVVDLEPSPQQASPPQTPSSGPAVFDERLLDDAPDGMIFVPEPLPVESDDGP